VNPSRGIMLLLLAIAVFSVMTGLVKVVDEVPAGQIVFFRSAFAFHKLV